MNLLGTKIPRVELEEVGPHMDLKILRRRTAARLVMNIDKILESKMIVYNTYAYLCFF